ncbi:MAG: peptidase [Pseudomonadota bacterium]
MEKLLKHHLTNMQKWLQSRDYPYSDNADIIISDKTFDNGALYGLEIPIVNSFNILQTTIKYLESYSLQCDRFNETRGSFLLSDSEIKDMLGLCFEKKIGITFALSARPEYDVKSSFYKSKFGLEQCRKLNNVDAIAYTLDEAVRLAELGCRGLIVYDDGVLSLLQRMRTENTLPKDMYFKASSHCMATNPFISQLLFNQGANSVTTIHDASLSVLAQTRQLCKDLILDIPIDVYKDKGGYIRYNEIANIVRVSSPCILKVGASAQANPYDSINDKIIQNRVKRAYVAHEHLLRQLDESSKQAIPDNVKCLPNFH